MDMFGVPNQAKSKFFAFPGDAGNFNTPNTGGKRFIFPKSAQMAMFLLIGPGGKGGNGFTFTAGVGGGGGGGGGSGASVWLMGPVSMFPDTLLMFPGGGPARASSINWQHSASPTAISTFAVGNAGGNGGNGGSGASGGTGGTGASSSPITNLRVPFSRGATGTAGTIGSSTGAAQPGSTTAGGNTCGGGAGGGVDNANTYRAGGNGVSGFIFQSSSGIVTSAGGSVGSAAVDGGPGFGTKLTDFTKPGSYLFFASGAGGGSGKNGGNGAPGDWGCGGGGGGAGLSGSGVGGTGGNGGPGLILVWCW